MQTVFTVEFFDDNGASDLGVLNILINRFLDGRNACHIAYAHQYKVLYLVGDSGDGLSPLTLGGAGSVSNSQCTIRGEGSSVAASGTNGLAPISDTTG